MNSIFHRISVRKYEDKPVEKEKIMEILKAGMQAPSACNQQPWEFYVVTDKEKIQKLSKVTPYTVCAAGAPAVIVPVYHTEGLVAPSFAQIDMSIAQENIWLETDAQGLGGGGHAGRRHCSFARRGDRPFPGRMHRAGSAAAGGVPPDQTDVRCVRCRGECFAPGGDWRPCTGCAACPGAVAGAF